MRTATPRSARRRGDEAGFTMVELMASLTILAVGIVGVIGVMNSSFRVVGTTSARNKGVAVATLWIEKLRAMPYDQLPLTLTNCSPPTAPPCQPKRPPPETINNRKYSIEYAVTMEDEQTTSSQTDTVIVDDAYKKAYVWVSWNDESGFHRLGQTTLLYPGGRGVFNAGAAVTQGSTSGAAPNPPSGLQAVRVPTSTGIDLSWTPPPAVSNVPEAVTWVIQYSEDAGFPLGLQEVTLQVPGDVHTVRLNDLVALTTYHFRIYAKAANGRISSAPYPDPTKPEQLPVTEVTDSTSASACAVGAASVTPSALNKKKGNEGSGLPLNPRVELSTSGPCGSFSFHMEYSPRTAKVDTVPLLGSVTYAGDVKGTTQTWEVGEHDIKVFSVVGGVKVLRATLRLIVCDSQKKVCP